MSTVRTTIIMRVAVSGVEYIEFDPSQPQDFCAIPFLEWRTNGAKFAPFHSKPLSECARRKHAPFALPNGARMAHRHPHSPSGLSLRARDSAPQRDDPKEELAHAGTVPAGLELEPVRREEQSIRNESLGTHDYVDGISRLDLKRRSERRPLFHQLNRLAEDRDRSKEKRRRVNSEIKTLGTRDFAS
jgi:hypothetical protein